MYTPGPDSHSFSPLTEPDERGRFGDFGGKFAPEALMPALEEFLRQGVDERVTAEEADAALLALMEDA